MTITEGETVYFLYGSETGNCESIAKRLHHVATTEKGLPAAQCMTLNEAIAKKVLERQVAPPATPTSVGDVCLVIVVSTTGEGEPPENAARFRRWLRNLKNSTVVNVRYTVLALGDTNYNNFCAAGKFIDAKLAEYGARRFYPRGEADDGIGLELVVDPWTEGVWAALEEVRPPPAAPGSSPPTPAGGNDAPAGQADPSSAPASAAPAAAPSPLPVVGNETYQAHPQRVDMAVAMETAIVYANASQICATIALFLYERVVELGGAATLYPIQYFSPDRVKPEAKIVLFVLCTDSDEHTLYEHCAQLHTREMPLGPFAELLLRPSVPPASQLSPQAAALVKWMGDPAMRFYSSVCVAPKLASVPQATVLANRVRAVATSCKLDRLSKRQSETEASAVAVAEADVCTWAETVLDNLPGVTADAATIAASVDWFFDARVGPAFREAYAEDTGLSSALGGISPFTPPTGTRSTFVWPVGVGGGGGAVGGGSGQEPSVDSRRSGNTAPSTAGGPAAGPRGAGRLRRPNHYHPHYHHQFANGDGASPNPKASAPTAMIGEESTAVDDMNRESGSRPVPPPGRRRGEEPKDSKLLNEYILTPVVFLYSGGAFISQVAHDMNAGAAAHHLRSSVSDLNNFGHTGFPRRATFVFVVGGTMTKAMTRLFKTLKTMTGEGRDIAGVKFAILGIDETSQNEKFNVCALELETLLLSLHAMKIHCTGLADMDDADGLQPVLKAWSTNLWSAILHPSVSMAYLDAASPNIAAGKVFPSSSPLHESDGSPSAIMRQASSATHGSPTSHVVTVVGPIGPDRAAASSSSAAALRRSPSYAQHASPPYQQQDSSPSAAAVADVALDLDAVAGGADNATAPAAPSAPLFPWDSVPLNRDNAHATPLAVLYSSSGMAKTMAFHAITSARELGFPATIHPFSHYDRVDFTETPNLILFCECGADGRSSGGKRFRKYLLSSSHRPDYLSHVRFAVLGLGPAPPAVVHPAFAWSNMLCRLQASRVFPVVIMPSLSQIFSLGIPWCECTFATLALTVPTAGAGQRMADDKQHHLATRLTGSSVSLAETAKPSPRDEEQSRQQPMSVLFLYGCSTGLSEAIARDFHANALDKGYTSRIATLNYFERMNFVSADNVVIVCSTVWTNAGGYPDNARRFARYVHRKSQPTNLLSSAHTRFAVLGLDNGFGEERDACGNILVQGDEKEEGRLRKRDRFCRPAKRLDTRLEELGGSRLCPVGCVDVSMVLAEPVEAWRKQLFDALDARDAELRHVEAASSPIPHSASAMSIPDGAALAHHTAPPAAGEGAATRLDALNKNSNSNTSPFRVLIAHASTPKSAVVGIAEHLERVLRETMCENLIVARRPMNELTRVEWRNDFHSVVFVLASGGDSEYPLDGSTFLRLLRHKGNPADMFAGVRYTVLAVSDSNGGHFHLGQSLDRRMKELGATRFYARGEAVDSFSLYKSVERWISGLLDALNSLHDAARKVERAGGHKGGEAATDAWLVDVGSPRNIAVPWPQQQPQGSGHDMGQANETVAAGVDLTSEVAATATTRLDLSHSEHRGDHASTSVLSNSVDACRSASYSVCEGILHSWQRLTANAVEEPVILMNLRVDGETTRWEPGQTVAVMPANEVATVGKLLTRLGVNGDDPFHPLSVAGPESSSYPTSPIYSAVDFPASCSTVLLRYVSLRLTKANRSFFSLLEARASHDKDKEKVRELVAKLSPPPGSTTSTVAARAAPLDLLDVLLAVPDVVVPFRHVVEHLSLLQPRVYSIASSSVADPTTLSLCFKVVKHGLCTNWMYELCQWTAGGAPHAHNVLMPAKRRVSLRFTVRPRTDFRMPRDLLIPLILIGPGTGVSPFRAFLQERESSLKRRRGEEEQGEASGGGAANTPLGAAVESVPPHGIIDLYFGCHRAADDFLFADELEGFEKRGVLNSLSVAFSREPNDGAFWYGGCYVQDRLLENGVGVAELITQRGARLYVCGDAESMAKEVHQTLVEILQQQLCVSGAEAAEYVEGMMKSGRYIRDVWTVSPP